MTAEPIDDIVAWSAKLSPWRQDCLRRLAISAELSEDDLGELMALVKSSGGLPLEKAPPAPIPFQKSHFGGGKQQPVVLKGIANVENVNRLVPKAGLTFCPDKLTVIYGRNGSGKSGFVRILRTAWTTDGYRVRAVAKLESEKLGAFSMSGSPARSRKCTWSTQRAERRHSLERSRSV